MGKTISEQLRAAIQDSGLSHNELAKATGVNQPSISRFVSGDRGLGSESIDKLAAYLGLELRQASKNRA
jgi:plasmid maintenance system antidote protein VapI